MLFEPQTDRYPDQYPWALDYVKALRDGFWTVDKFSFEADILDYSTKLSPETKKLLIRALACIAQIEVDVKTFWLKLGFTFNHPSLWSMGITFAHVEDIHDKAYARLTEVLGQLEIFKEIMQTDVIKNRVKYLKKYNTRVYEDDKKQAIYSLILFSLFMENVSLFSQFYIVLFLNREDGVMKDTAQQVKYTRNEELLHAQGGIKLVNTLRAEYPHLFDAELEARIYEECRVAQEAEHNLIEWIMEGYDRPGLNVPLMKNFIDDRLNSSLQAIGFNPIFAISTNMIEETAWMERGAYTPVKFDFFHGENTEYVMEDMAREDDFDLTFAAAVKPVRKSAHLLAGN